MFSRLPQKLSFSLLGDEAKLAFRSQPGGIAKLASTRNIPDSDSYWNQYLELFDTASDVFTLISPHDVRRALYDAPENVATLIRVITSRLFNLVSDHTFPTAPNASVTSYATSFIRNSTGNSERNTTKEVLNCLRVLQRVLPVVFELDPESTRLEMEVFWKKEVVANEAAIPAPDAGRAQFVIEDEEEDEEEHADGAVPREAAGSSQTASPRPQAQPKMLPSVAERLFSCLIDLLFCCGFTLPAKIQVDHYKINYIIWEKGVGSTTDPGPSQAFESNRTEVLRTLLVLFSKQIYAPPSNLFTSPSLYTLHFVQHTQRRYVLTLLCSLLNTAMNAPTAGSHNLIGGVAGRLPYNHLVFKGEDTKANLVSTSLQVLCVLLDFQSGSARDNLGSDDTSSPSARTNTFRYFIAKLHRSSDFAFVLEGVIGILREQMSAIHPLLPGSKKPVPYIVETIIFFWKMIELNKKFRSYVLEADSAMDVLAYLLCFGLEIKDKPEQHGLCRVISYIVQSLSAEKAFGAKLTSPIKAQLPPKWSTMGNAGDFFINAVYNMIATTSGALNSLYPALIIALSNAGPYLKNLSINSSARLMQLFNAFCNPSFLLSDEGHPRLLFFMLEVFNSVLLRNLADNPNLVYNIVRAHKAFEDLGTFTLARGLREIRRVQLAKEELARREGDKGKTRDSRANSIDNAAPSDDKARLLRSESTHSIDAQVSGLADDIEAQRISSGDEHTTGRPLMSPTIPDASMAEAQQSALSEKARGKMRAGRSASDDMTASLERLAAAGVGRNGFVPTQEWVTSWQQGLPLDNIMVVCSELYPKIQELKNSLSGANANTAIVDLLRSAALEHHLPQPAPAPSRRFAWSDASIVWLTSLIWGEVYVRGMSPFGLWNSTSVRLFYVKHTQVQQRQITEAVSNVVGGLLGRTESSQSLRQRT